MIYLSEKTVTLNEEQAKCLQACISAIRTGSNYTSIKKVMQILNWERDKTLETLEFLEEQGYIREIGKEEGFKRVYIFELTSKAIKMIYDN